MSSGAGSGSGTNSGGSAGSGNGTPAPNNAAGSAPKNGKTRDNSNGGPAADARKNSNRDNNDSAAGMSAPGSGRAGSFATRTKLGPPGSPKPKGPGAASSPAKPGAGGPDASKSGSFAKRATSGGPGAGASGGSASGVALDMVDQLPGIGKHIEAKNDSAERMRKKGKSGAKVDKAAKADAAADRAGNSKLPIKVGDKATATKKAKVAHVAKETIRGGLEEGGPVGLALGAAQGIASVTKRRHIVIGVGAVLAVSMLPFLALIVAVAVLVATIGGGVSTATAQSAVATTGYATADVQTMQAATQGTPTPWELLAATAYYETGAGAPVSQVPGSCPANSPVGAVCASVVSPPGSSTLSGGGSGGTSGGGGTGTGTGGSTSSGGRNGHVPVTLAPSSPDLTSTDTADWACIRQAENSGSYSGGGGAYGILQNTWSSLNMPGTPGNAAPALQDQAALAEINSPADFYGKLPGQNVYRNFSPWNDPCTGTLGAPNTGEAVIPPGIETPPNYYTGGPTTGGGGSGSGTGSGGGTTNSLCVGTGVGPYCLSSSATTNATDLATSSHWVAVQVGDSLTSSGALGNQETLDLTSGVTVDTVNGYPPVIDPSNKQVAAAQTATLAALAALPIDGNNAALDLNIYNLAVDWSVGYSPEVNASCAAPVPTGSNTSIPGPLNGGVATTIPVTSAQITLAGQIVTEAQAKGASIDTATAALVGALAQSPAGFLPGYATSGIYGNGNTDVKASVDAFVAKVTGPTATPDAQAQTALGGPLAMYSGWVAGAKQLVQIASSSTTPGCTSGSYPVVPGGTPQAQKAMAVAKTEVGVPYVWGGTSPSGFDCSGLMLYSYAQAGVSLPRTSESQYDMVKNAGGITMNPSQLQPGDLVFYNPGEDGIAGKPGHVVMYIGNGMTIQAPYTGKTVFIGPLSTANWMGGGPVPIPSSSGGPGPGPGTGPTPIK